MFVDNRHVRRMNAAGARFVKVSLGRHKDGSQGVTLTADSGDYFHFADVQALAALSDDIRVAVNEWRAEIQSGECGCDLCEREREED